MIVEIMFNQGSKRIEKDLIAMIETIKIERNIKNIMIDQEVMIKRRSIRIEDQEIRRNIETMVILTRL